MEGHNVSADFIEVHYKSAMDFLKKYGCVIDIPKRRLWLQDVAVPLESLAIAKQEREFCQAVVTLTEKVKVPPWSELEVLVSTSAMCTIGTWLVEGKNKSYGEMSGHQSCKSYIVALF